MRKVLHTFVQMLTMRTTSQRLRPINALTGHIESAQSYMSGYPTYRELATELGRPFSPLCGRPTRCAKSANLGSRCKD
jgi:hypothetical protein